MKTWKEMTKLETKTKVRILFHSVMAIFSTIVAIIDKDFTWILVALLWANVAIMEYCDAKLLKGRDVIIDLQERNIETKEKIIKHLVEEIDTLRDMRIIELDKIKIPSSFIKPRSKKLKGRTEYYKEYQQFAVPVIIDKNNTLVDGYTTYLIAKQNNFSHLKVRIV